MGIYQRSNGWQIKVTRKGKTHREQFHGTHEEAQQREKDIIADLTAGRAVLSSPGATGLGGSVATLADCHESARKKWRQVRASTRREYELVATQILSDFRETPVRDIDEDMVNDYINGMLDAGKAPSTILHRGNILRQLLRVAEAKKWIEKAPTVPRVKKREGRIRFLDPDEVEAMETALREASQDQIADIMLLAIDTGMRWGEIATLTPNDIQWDMRRIYLEGTKTKSGKSRSIPLTPRASAILRSWEGNKRRPVFTVSYYKLVRAWNRARETVGLEMGHDTSFHITRHTCASRLVQSMRTGGEIVAVQQWLGHSDIKTTMGYIHLAPNALDDLRDALVDGGHADQGLLANMDDDCDDFCDDHVPNVTKLGNVIRLSH